MKYTKRSYSIWRTIQPLVILAAFALAGISAFFYFAGY